MRRLLPVLLVGVVGLTGCGGSHAPTGGGGTGAAAGPASAQTFTVRANARDQYVPQTITATVGTLTLSLHTGGVPHDLRFRTSGLPGIGTVSGDVTKSTTLTFTAPGTYVFECTIHPGMEGKVVVSGSPAR